MARAIKYRLQFKSLNGTGCLVNIWVEGASSSADTSKTGANVPFDVESGVTALTGADNPIEWEEDNDESLLSVVRTKTGYIRVVESSYGALSNLYPTTDTSHYVEFYYGSALYFTGFMQAQAFDAAWAPGPRVIDFPIQSPLAVAKGLHFSAPTNPGFVNIANLLYQTRTLLNANISHIIFPTGISINNTNFTVQWCISTLVCCPFNDEFDRSASASNSLYAPLTVYEFLEGLCNCLGLIVHDMPNYLVFSRFDYNGNYYNYDASSLNISPTGNPSTSGSFENDLSSANILSSDNMEDEITPLSKIELNYEGDFFESEGIEYDHMRANAPVGEGSTSCQLVPVGYEVESNYLITGIPSSSNPGVSVGAWGGGNNIKESFLICAGSWPSTAKILKYRFLIPPKNGGFTVTMPVTQGTDLDEPTGGTVSFGVIIKNGSNYYNADDNVRAWGTTEVVNTVWRFDETRALKIEVIRGCPDANSYLEIIIVKGSELVSAGLVHLENITVSQGQTPGFNYYQTAINEGKRKKVLKVDNGSKEEASISLLFNTAIKNKAMVIPSNADAYWDGQLACSYSYLFQAQRRVTIDTFISHLPTIYTNRILFRNSGWHWRVISIGFCPWDDRMRVALVYSPTI